MLRFVFTFLLLSLYFKTIAAQERQIAGGVLPKISLTYAANKVWQINGQLESMNGFFSRNTMGEMRGKYNYRRTDFKLINSFKINPFWSLAAGYQYRQEPGTDMNRTLQQLAYADKRRGYRLGHRVRSDQSFESDENPEIRLRYRFSFEWALSGLTVDPGEFYFILSDEILYSWQRPNHDLENRITPKIGYNFSKANKLELGIDYRADSFVDGGYVQQFWLAVDWYINF